MTPPIQAPERATETKPSLAQRLRRRLGLRRREARPQLAPASDAYTAALAALAPRGTRVECVPVVALEEGRARVLLGDGRQVTPTWALPYAYAPAEGDVLWVISRGERHYVLGVERGAGTSLLWFPGDLAVRAEGRLKLSARRALRLTGAQISLRAQLLERVAESLESSTRESRLVLKGLLRTFASGARRVVEDEDYRTARGLTQLARDLVKIDAELIKLQ